MPRAYQMPLWSALEGGCKRAVAVWHRRGGKDATALNWTAVQAMQRVGVYWHMLPTLTQARKVVWDGIDRQGRRIIDQVFPRALRCSRNDADMKLGLVNGSLWQCVGSDNYDSLVGANPVGVVFSEYSLADPAAWDFIRPILAENGGWALFIYTPRGRNHGWRLFNAARHNAGWFAESLSVEDTKAIPLTAIDDDRASGMDEETIQQEYWCSFEAAVRGAYYGKLMVRAEAEKRLGRVPHDPAYPVITAWDLGFSDSTCIWFAQLVGSEARIIDYYEASGVGLDHYAKILAEKNYVYAEHLLPHDAAASELGTGTTRLETLCKLGIRGRVLPAVRVDDGINAVRMLLPRCWFDELRCARGLDALRLYQREWDDRAQDFKARPRHDWTSHAADAFRYLAMGLDSQRTGSFSTLSYKSLRVC